MTQGANIDHLLHSPALAGTAACDFSKTSSPADPLRRWTGQGTQSLFHTYNWATWAVKWWCQDPIKSRAGASAQTQLSVFLLLPPGSDCEQTQRGSPSFRCASPFRHPRTMTLNLKQVCLGRNVYSAAVECPVEF